MQYTLHERDCYMRQSELTRNERWIKVYNALLSTDHHSRAARVGTDRTNGLEQGLVPFLEEGSLLR